MNKNRYKRYSVDFFDQITSKNVYYKNIINKPPAMPYI